MAQKIYVLDTNVLLHDAESILKFEDNIVALPLKTIEEMDNFKKNSNETGRNARRCSRILDSLRQQGTLTNGGVELESGGRVRVALAKPGDVADLPPELQKERNGDNTILAVALRLKKENAELPVILVTKDTNLRIKADAIGLRVEDYENDKVSYSDLYTGCETLIVLGADIDRFFRDKSCSIDALTCFDEQGLEIEPDLYPHQCVTLKGVHGKQSALAIVDERCMDLLPLPSLPAEGFWGIHPRNREQEFAIALLSNPQIHLVTLIGKAGTGKTLMAIAAGLQQVSEEHAYSRMLVSRPVFPMGKDIGFLPGEVEEKLAPWMQPIYDNVDLLLSGNNKMALDKGARPSRGKSRGYQDLVEMGLIQIEALTYIRGRSIPRQYMIVDEAQNLTPHEIKTIITRAGEGTKIILTGDPDQIDNPFVNSDTNGLTYVVEHFKDEAIAAHITLKNGERSALAEIASNIL